MRKEDYQETLTPHLKTSDGNLKLDHSRLFQQDRVDVKQTTKWLHDNKVKVSASLIHDTNLK